MTGLRARIGRGVTFIHDPVPLKDHRPALGLLRRMRSDPRIVRDLPKVLAGEGEEFDEIDWPFGESLVDPGPSSPPPYNWATRFAWPRDGCVS